MRVPKRLALTLSLCFIAGVTCAEPTFQSIIDFVQANAERRADLLRNSSGTCTVHLQYEAGEDRPAEKISFSMDNFHFAPNDTAQVRWMQRGDALRFDVTLPEPPTPAADWSPFPPQNTRTLLDGLRSTTYDVSNDSTVIDEQPPASVNPTAVLFRFEPALLYRFRGQALHERLKEFQALGWHPVISEREKDGNRLLTLEYTWKRGDHGRDREGTTLYTLATNQGYSLVQGVYRNRLFHNGEFSTEVFESYDATYIESPEHKGIWLLTHLRHLTDTSGTLDATEITFTETRVGIELPDRDFTPEGLGIKNGEVTEE